MITKGPIKACKIYSAKRINKDDNGPCEERMFQVSDYRRAAHWVPCCSLNRLYWIISAYLGIKPLWANIRQPMSIDWGDWGVGLLLKLIQLPEDLPRH